MKVFLGQIRPIPGLLDYWNKKLEYKFLKFFTKEDELLQIPNKFGSYIIENNKVDYMTNQVSRLIIQFYPDGFLQEIRNEKLESLGI